MPTEHQAEIGRLSHLALGRAIEDGLRPEDAYAILRLATATTRYSPRARSRRARVLVHRAVATYLRRYLPAPPWVLAGREVALGGLRTDLHWRHPDGEHFFDELKSEPATLLVKDEAARAQALAYLELGRALPGHFLGVRLISLGVPSGLVAIAASESPLPRIAEDGR
jgi:hypothetical protein